MRLQTAYLLQQSSELIHPARPSLHILHGDTHNHVSSPPSLTAQPSPTDGGGGDSGLAFLGAMLGIQGLKGHLLKFGPVLCTGPLEARDRVWAFLLKSDTNNLQVGAVPLSAEISLLYSSCQNTPFFTLV